jgi:hypothetical protein
MSYDLWLVVKEFADTMEINVEEWRDAKPCGVPVTSTEIALLFHALAKTSEPCLHDFVEALSEVVPPDKEAPSLKSRVQHCSTFTPCITDIGKTHQED